VLVEAATGAAVAWMLSPLIGLLVTGGLTVAGVVLMRRRPVATGVANGTAMGTAMASARATVGGAGGPEGVAVQ
jgi:hypothetical protein